MIEKALMKDNNWINEVEVSTMIASFPIEKLGDVNWISLPDFKNIEKAKKTIAKDILMAADNSLCHK